ncbi:HipA domain-containing protein [Pectinatus sottacetonis]|uniref:hypothetical protein n=1 Tax=Pectinatus sottacetonis TaxID=1002795 RepID=UPI0018C468C0|nr:hypothetical protein [Pectinatus sottacetonis]
MVRFNDWQINNYRFYGGRTGYKICMNDDSNKPYMVKILKDTDIASSAVNEYIGCHIFKLLGIEAQTTILGEYECNNKIYSAVACEDFNINRYRLQEFFKIKNTCITASRKNKSLLSTLNAIKEQKMINSVMLNEFYWDMYIVDALLGNFDRNDSNWGILANEDLQEFKIAPVYGCEYVK